MDDMLTGVNSVEEGQKLSDQLLNLLQSAGLCLRKWTSNCSELLEKIPVDLRDDRTVYDLDSPTSCIKTLGLKWQPTTDNFLFETPEYSNHDNPVTKRIAVSDSAKLFDPLGLVGPVIVAAKMYLQELWRNETSWDEPLNPPLQKQWRDFRKNLAELNNISIQRWVLSHTPVKQIQLHGFCDASEKAYGACIYIRSVSSDDTVTVNLLTAKSKVAPLATSRKQKRVCLPRLELSAALLLAHLYEKVSGALKIEIKPYFWSDSSIVLHWLAANPSRWKTFVANRVSEIQHLTANGKWNHVPGIENPADIISRGMDPAQLQHATLWWNGPNWLNEEPLIFPTKVASKVELPKEDLEERVTLAAHSIEPSFIFKLRSSFGDLKRLVAWILRFAHNAKLKNRDQRRYTHLTTEELNDSIKCLVRLAQHESR
uniref:uncharacterized protein LOC125906840 n=1 Tax=Anopheles coluzzii TaxID=1518534 RepID=UPI0020FFB739|nr:uncharacterized protein LOC125906840 [Anopheles coluzzii]